LHDEAWRHERNKSEDDCGKQCWMLGTTAGYYCNKGDGEHDTNCVVRNPSIVHSALFCGAEAIFKFLVACSEASAQQNLCWME